jgi:hypothetical protein
MQRVIVINYGQVIFDDRVSSLKQRYAHKVVGFVCRTLEGFTLDGVEVLKVGDYGVGLQFDARQTPVSVLRRLMDAPVGHHSERSAHGGDIRSIYEAPPEVKR